MQTIGLAVFCAVVALNVLGLFADVIVGQCGLRTVSEHARKTPLIAQLIIFVNVVGIIGLMIHFSGEDK